MGRLMVKQRLSLRNLFSGTMFSEAKVPIGRSRAVVSVFHEIKDNSSGEDGELASDKAQAEEATQDVGNGCYSCFLISTLKSGNAAMDICRKLLLLQYLVYILQ